MTQCRLLNISRVVATGAGLVGVPADGGTGGSLRGMVHQRMTQCRLLDIGGVGAAGAGLVGAPADGGAGGCLRGVVHEGVGVRVGAAVVALAIRAVGLRGAGRSGGLLMGSIVPVAGVVFAGLIMLLAVAAVLPYAVPGVLQHGNLAVGGVGAARALAGLVGVPADLRTACCLRTVGFEVVVARVGAAVAGIANRA